jgi:hypothetical protein
MPESLDAYLAALKASLAGSDRAVIQDSLYDCQERWNRELARLSWEEPLLLPADAQAKALAALGTPEEAAEGYRQRESLVAEALSTPRPHKVSVDAPPSPWPTAWGVFAEPKAYTSVLYLLLSLPAGIFTFTWAVTGLSLSLGMIVLVIGLPMLLFFLGSCRALGLAEGRLVEALLDVRMPRRPTLLPKGLGWTERLGNLFRDGYTWTSLVYLLLRLPLGILTFTAMAIAFALSAGFMAAPLLKVLSPRSSEIVIFSTHYGPGAMPPLGLLVGLAFLGALGLMGTLHLALALGRLQGWVARLLLVQR